MFSKWSPIAKLDRNTPSQGIGRSAQGQLHFHMVEKMYAAICIDRGNTQHHPTRIV